MSIVTHIKDHLRMGVPSNKDWDLSLISDRRKLKRWFSGGIAGKKIVFSGDSTTLHLQTGFGSPTENIFRDGRFGRAQIKYPALRDVTVYARGENGGTLAYFLSNLFTEDHRDDGGTDFYSEDTFSNMDAILALEADLYVLSWGINDCLNNAATYTAADLQDDLTTAVNTIKAALPNASIILRMPNAHASDATYYSGGATAQNMMDRYQTAYRALRDTWDDVLVWDSQTCLYPGVAWATKANVFLLNTDGFHPSVSGYDQILDHILGLLIPDEKTREAQWQNELSRSSPFMRNQTDNLLRWHPDVDPLILEGDDWYKVYRVRYQSGARASYFRLTFYDYADQVNTTAGNAARANAWSSGVAAPGLVPGDIISFGNRSGQGNTFVMNRPVDLAFNVYTLQWGPHPGGSWSAAETEDLVSGHPLPDAIYFGYVYRHKYAHCEGMRILQGLLENPVEYDATAATTNPYKVARRFYISATPALGAFTAQTIGSENTGDLSALTWNTTDLICIPGVTTGLRSSEYHAAQAMPLSGATFTPDGTNKRMAVTGVTLSGALVDFSKYVIPQGYLLQAT